MYCLKSGKILQQHYHAEMSFRGNSMDFTYKELALLNRMIGIALMSGKVEFDEVSESVHQKVAQEIYEQIQDEIQNEDIGS